MYKKILKEWLLILFFIKGWVVTAIIALLSKDKVHIWIIFFVLVLGVLLEAYYLSLER
ncbi:hypothetical protein [Psychrilyobacter atlanticus]|uniref:hypothetical protein n=1 Tax=Psychrilyobacter atlanticus TaxID=271091 RepID=UPI0012EC94F5|nr:hypothetical protein [Psychrilyobacter atlanticus]